MRSKGQRWPRGTGLVNRRTTQSRLPQPAVPAVPGSACSACRQVLELEAQLHQLSPCTHYYEGL